MEAREIELQRPPFSGSCTGEGQRPCGGQGAMDQRRERSEVGEQGWFRRQGEALRFGPDNR